MIPNENLEIFRSSHWVVRHSSEAAIPGYVVVGSVHSGSSLGDLPKDACDELGFLLQCTSQAVESAVKPQRVYVCMFNEAYVAVHFHVFPRMNWMKDFSSDFGRSGALIDGGIVFSAARRAKADPAVILEAEAQIVAAAATIRKFVGEAMGSRLASRI